MSSKNTPQKLFAAIPALCASNSKKLSIYNEEMLVARCFLGFILFLKSLGKTFKETLDGRIQAITEESQQFPNEVVPPEANEQQLLVRIRLKRFGTVVDSLPMERLGPTCEKTLNALCSRNLQVKSATIQQATLYRRSLLKDDLVKGFHSLVSSSVPCTTALVREGLEVLRSAQNTQCILKRELE